MDEDQKTVFLEKLGLVHYSSIKFFDNINQKCDQTNQEIDFFIVPNFTASQIYSAPSDSDKSLRKCRLFKRKTVADNLNIEYTLTNENKFSYFEDSDCDDDFKDNSFDENCDFDEKVSRKKRKKHKSLNVDKTPINKEVPTSSLSKLELQKLAQDLTTISITEAKKLFSLEKPLEPVISTKLKFEDSENLNMLKIVIASGRYGNGHRTGFWKKYLNMFPNRSLGTLVSHWKFALVQNPKRTSRLLKEIGFRDKLLDTILNLIINVGIAEDEELEQAISIVPEENVSDLMNHMELTISQLVPSSESD